MVAGACYAHGGSEQEARPRTGNQGARRLSWLSWRPRALLLAVFGAICAVVPALLMWGFTVDDAFISLRYARNLGSGAGYRFNVGGPVTDGVTPLPWAPLLVPLARVPDLVDALARAKVLGIIVWTIAAALLGYALGSTKKEDANDDDDDERHTFAYGVIALATVGLAFPIGAHAASGMETGLATALTTLSAVSFDKPRRAALLSGLAASLRPELVMWAVILATGAGIAHAVRALPSDEIAGRRQIAIAKRTLAPVLIAIAPFALCALIRLIAFGRAAPLSLLAKPSDLSHGFIYAGAASIVVLTPLLAFAPIALVRRGSAEAKTIALAAVVHIVVVIAVGGDWMPYARLMVPIAPSLAIVFVDVASVSHIASTAIRAFVTFSLGIAIAYSAAPAGRHVYDTRKSLIAEARAHLAEAHVVACVDIGWVGAALPDAEIVDLAGVTDPTVAILPGGHTSKAVDPGMLLDRNVDTVLIYGQPRWVENNLSSRRLFASHYHVTENLTPLRRGVGDPGIFYVVYERDRDRSAL